MRSLDSIANDLRLFAKYHLIRRVVDHPAPETELGVFELDYDWCAYTDELRSVSSELRVGELERISYDGMHYPILRVDGRGQAGAARLLVLAGVHGNERAGVLAVPGILRAWTELSDPRPHLTVVTPVNPVGAAKLSRYNGEGFDINRDFRRFETREARLVRRVADDVAPSFIVSLHEGPQEGTFLFTNGLVDAQLGSELLAEMERGGTELADRDYFGRRLNPPGYAPLTPTMTVLNVLWASTLGMMATGMWARERGIPEITIESSWRATDPSLRISGHVSLVRAVLAHLRSA